MKAFISEHTTNKNTLQKRTSLSKISWNLFYIEPKAIWNSESFNNFTISNKSKPNKHRRIPNVVRMLDQLSPVAPARVRVVLLPIGQIKRARFLSFVDRLQPENVVQLGDISPDGRPNRSEKKPKNLRRERHWNDADTLQICSHL